MDLSELMVAARIGELEKVKHLVETKEVDLNVRDKWDSTPLYYACLCGHEDVVQYLVDRGAKCEADTFDGERCLYAALTSSIKKILKNANLINARTMRRDNFEEFLRQLYETGQDYADVCFDVHGEKIFAHKCILFARSEFFSEKLMSKWQTKSVIRLNSKHLYPWTFKVFMQYLYTGSLDISLDQVEETLKLVEAVKAADLVAHIRERVKKAEAYKKLKPDSRFGRHLAVQLPNTCQLLANDFSLLASAALPRELTSWIDGSELPFLEERPLYAPFTDICFYVESHKFFCHKIFFCGRSDYFRALISDHFHESDAISCTPPVAADSSVSGPMAVPGGKDDFSSPCTSPLDNGAWPMTPQSPFASPDFHFGGTSPGVMTTPPSHDTNAGMLPLIRLHSVSYQVFEQIVNYVYTNHCDLSLDNVYDVLEAADQYLLPGLKSICGVFISQYLDVDNVVAVLETARLFGLHRLEGACLAFVAQNIEALLASPGLQRLILQDAADVRDRDTLQGDSIPIVDEIRSHISTNVQTWSHLEEAQQKIYLVQQLLEDLDLSACCQKETVFAEDAPPEPTTDEWETGFMMELPEDDAAME